MAVNLIQTDADTIDYDYENDSFFLFTKGAEYKHSLNLDNIIIDFGEGNSIKGVEIQNASKKFGVPKHALKTPHQIKIELDISHDKIVLNINLTLEIRNNTVSKAIIAADANKFNLSSGAMAMSCGVC